MQELIRINENGKATARELYEFLQLRAGDFARWCKTNITENRFALENVDWVRLRIHAETPTGGKVEREDFELTIDFAKKLCMASHSERGEQARNYFVEVEKRWKALSVTTPRQIKKPRRRSYMIKTAVNDIGATAKALTQVFGVRQEMALSVAYSTVTKNYEMDLSPLRSLVPAATHNIGRHIPTELGIRMGGVRAEEVNKKLEELGLQTGERDHNNRKKWILTDEGKEYGEYIPTTNNKNGHNDYQIQWSEKVLPMLEAAMKEGEKK